MSVRPFAMYDPGSINTTGHAKPVRFASRSARDRVSIKRMSMSPSRGRSCLAQSPKRSCKITGTFVNDRPLSLDPDELGTSYSVLKFRYTDCISIKADDRGLSPKYRCQLIDETGPQIRAGNWMTLWKRHSLRAVRSLESSVEVRVQFSGSGRTYGADQ